MAGRGPQIGEVDAECLLHPCTLIGIFRKVRQRERQDMLCGAGAIADEPAQVKHGVGLFDSEIGRHASRQPILLSRVTIGE